MLKEIWNKGRFLIIRNKAYKTKGAVILKGLLRNFSILSDDTCYRKHFNKITKPEIYRKHSFEHFVCCAFCRNLERSRCHEFCFSCSIGTYRECGPLTPGTFEFTGSYVDMPENELKPWIFRTPCAQFERLDSRKYFRNFTSNDLSVTTACYEAAEGIFCGISHGKRPCHICASVNLDIYNSCIRNGKVEENTPCNRIITEISSHYKTLSAIAGYSE